jgi:hypothetical protein
MCSILGGILQRVCDEEKNRGKGVGSLEGINPWLKCIADGLAE